VYILFKTKVKKDKINFLYNIVGLLLFIISYYLYYLSLEKCFDGEDGCSKQWNWIILKIKQLFVSIIILVILIYLIIFGVISNLHIFHFISIFICFYNYSHSSYFHDHGAFNLICVAVVIFISLLVLMIIKVLFSLLKNKYIYKMISVAVIAYLYYTILDPMNCDDWPKGLNNTFIQNDINKFGCQIKFPTTCQYKLMSYTQDLSKLSHIACENKSKLSRDNILKYSKSPYVNSNTLKFGFPLTNNNEGQKDGVDEIVLKTYTSYNLVDMDKNISPEFPLPEYIVDFSKDPLGELIINLNFNKTLSLERKALEKNSLPYSENIMILYIDSISRNNVLRKLKKTMKFFEKFISYKGAHNKKYPKENFHSFQFFKYHSFEGYTIGNFPQLFYGNDAKSKELVRITKYLKENGYITGYSTDQCQKDNTRTKHNLTKEELYDHQLVLCDPNAAILNSPVKRCLYGHLNSYHLYEYINQFWRKYQNNRKFSTIVINDAHEGTLESIKYTDDVIYNFLNSLFNDNFLKNSCVFLMSDHGSGMPSIYYLNEFYKIELSLPMLLIIINDRNIGYYQQYSNIYENQQTLITGYDIYNTIAHIIYGDNYINIPYKDYYHDTPKSPKGKSLLEKINPKERHPKNYEKMATNVCI